MWFLFAILSAVFAALTSILAKIGIEGVNSNLATAIRTVVVVIMAWGMVFLTHTQGRHCRDQQKKLDVPDPFGACDRRVVALLLPCPADRRGVQGGADRQAECGDHTYTGVCFSA